MLWELKRTVSLYETVLLSIQNICQFYAQQVSLPTNRQSCRAENIAELSRRFVFSLFWAKFELQNRLQQVVCSEMSD